MMRSSRRRAFMMIELLAMLIPAMILFGLLGYLITDFIKLQRRAGEHASRMSLADSLGARLRADAASADHAGWIEVDGGESVVTLHSPLNTTIEYRIERTGVTRVVAGSEDCVWSDPRLQFECDFPAGKRARLLLLTLEEQPPLGSTPLPPRRFVATFVLPAATEIRNEARP